jgi:hypothetical protein
MLKHNKKWLKFLHAETQQKMVEILFTVVAPAGLLT